MKASPIIVALDVADGARALALAARVAPWVGAVKVGKELFVAEGPALVRELQARGAPVFLDLKFHDIPNTVARAVAGAVRLGVRMLTVHAGGGTAMLSAAAKAAEETAAPPGSPRPLVLAVTVLTSFDSAALEAVGVTGGVEEQVHRLARLAVDAGVGGLVCSPLELARLRRWLPREVQCVTPGIRSPGDPADDQRRTMGPREAVAAGADWLVVGRPIHAAPDPGRAAQAMFEAIKGS